MREGLKRWWAWETRWFRWGPDGPTVLQRWRLVVLLAVLAAVVVAAWTAGASTG